MSRLTPRRGRRTSLQRPRCFVRAGVASGRHRGSRDRSSSERPFRAANAAALPGRLLLAGRPRLRTSRGARPTAGHALSVCAIERLASSARAASTKTCLSAVAKAGTARRCGSAAARAAASRAAHGPGRWRLRSHATGKLTASNAWILSTQRSQRKYRSRSHIRLSPARHRADRSSAAPATGTRRAGGNQQTRVAADNALATRFDSVDFEVVPLVLLPRALVTLPSAEHPRRRRRRRC